MNVLVLNTGSSALKFQVIATDLDTIEKNADRQLARGLIERIGSESLVTFRVEGKPAGRRTAALPRPRAPPQPGDPQGHLRRPRAARPRRPPGGGLRHLLPLHDARGLVPLRDP